MVKNVFLLSAEKKREIKFRGGGEWKRPSNTKKNCQVKKKMGGGGKRLRFRVSTTM